MSELTAEQREQLARGLYMAGGPAGAVALRLARSQADALAPTVAAIVASAWPCANYLAPLTCLTAPSSEAARCDFCTSVAEAERERIVAAVEAALGGRCGSAVDVYLSAVQNRWERIDAPNNMAVECPCEESAHLNALHDLAIDDVPLLLAAVRAALASAAPDALAETRTEWERHERLHLTDGCFHDSCGYCQRRRVHGGTGAEAAPDALARVKAEALREAADELAIESSLTDCTRRPDQYADARDDERVDNVGFLRDRANRIARGES